MNPLVVQILGGLLAIVFIVFLVMSWKTWRIWHIIFSFLVFAAAATFMVFAACTLKTRAAWQSLQYKYTQAVDRAQATEQKWLYGDPLSIEQKEDSIRSVLAELNHVVVHRGRIWRGCTPKESPDPNTIRISTVPANLPATAKPQPNNIKEKLILYVFTEADTPEGLKVPAVYLGEFEAKEPTDTEVSLSPTLPLDPDQIDKIKAGGTTWALYELTPLDGYELFAKLDPQENLLVGMEKEDLKKYIPNQFGWSEEQYDKLLDTFYRFDRPATENDPPDNVWVQVKFLKEHTFVVDATTEESPLEANKFFDSSGRAVTRILRRGENGEVKFAKDSLGIFDPTTAEKELIGPGICEKVRLLYRRPLHDYAHFFRESFQRHIELNDSIRRATRGAEEMVALATKAKEQQAYHELEKVKLQQELVRFRQENVDVVGYGKRLDGEWRALVQRLSELYRKNLQLEQELKRLQFQQAAAINQRVAAPSPPPPTAPPVP